MRPTPDSRSSYLLMCILRTRMGSSGAAYLGQRIDSAGFGTALVQRLGGGMSDGRRHTMRSALHILLAIAGF